MADSTKSYDKDSIKVLSDINSLEFKSCTGRNPDYVWIYL